MLAQQRDRVGLDGEPDLLGQPDELVDLVRVVVAGGDGQQQLPGGLGQAGAAGLAGSARGAPADDDTAQDERTASTRLTNSRGLKGLTM